MMLQFTDINSDVSFRLKSSTAPPKQTSGCIDCMLLFTRSTSVCLCGITPMTKSLIRKLIITRETIERRQWGYVAAKCHQQPGDRVGREKGAGCWARVTNILQRPKLVDAEDLRPPPGSRSTGRAVTGSRGLWGTGKEHPGALSVLMQGQAQLWATGASLESHRWQPGQHQRASHRIAPLRLLCVQPGE